MNLYESKGVSRPNKKERRMEVENGTRREIRKDYGREWKEEAKEEDEKQKIRTNSAQRTIRTKRRR